MPSKVEINAYTYHLCSSTDPRIRWMQLQLAHFRRFLDECDRHFVRLSTKTCQNAYLFRMARCNCLRISLRISASCLLHHRMGHEFHWHDAHMAWFRMGGNLDSIHMARRSQSPCAPSSSKQPREILWQKTNANYFIVAQPQRKKQINSISIKYSTHPLQPNPHVWQHDTKSSAEMWTLSVPLLWMHVCWTDSKWICVNFLRNFSQRGQLTRSDMASTAPNAQHEPQLPWSRISRMVGQFGHCKRESNSVGKSSLMLPNSLAGCWNRFESGWTPMMPRKKDSGVSTWKFEPACGQNENRIWKNAIQMTWNVAQLIPAMLMLCC